MRVKRISALNGTHVEYLLQPRVASSRDLEVSWSSLFTPVLSIFERVKSELPMNYGFKFQIRIQIELEKFSFENDKLIVVQVWFPSDSFSVISSHTFVKKLKQAFQTLLGRFDNFVQKGSGWVLKKVLKYSISVMKYRLFQGGCANGGLPQKLLRKRALIMLKNKGKNEMCFLYAVAAAIAMKKKNPSRLSKDYKEIVSQLSEKFAIFPVDLRGVNKFEKLYPISVNIYGYNSEKDIFYPCRVSDKVDKPLHANLVYYCKHYFPVRNLSSLIGGFAKKNRRKCFVCQYCLAYFIKEKSYDLHMRLCNRDRQQLEMPSKDRAFMKFDYYRSLNACPFVIYADFETCINEEEVINKGKTVSKKAHTAVACSAYTVCTLDDTLSSEQPFIYVGEDCVDVLFAYLELQFYCIAFILNYHYVPIKKMSMRQQRNFRRAKKCHMCRRPFHSQHLDKVRDHCHITGNYRRALCSNCNIVYARTQKDVPIFFHGLGHYDQHFIIQRLHRYKESSIKIIPKNSEKFLTFSIDNAIFKDSYQFLDSSLSLLVSNLRDKGEEFFFHVNKVFKDPEQRALLYRKGVFPYNYLQALNVLDETVLPPIESFYNDLSRENITPEDYDFAKKVWKAFNCRNLGDYLQIYLLADTLLLADCFESFRHTSIRNYRLDPSHFYSNAHYSLNAYLRFSGVTLDLFTDINMHLFIAKGIRGGLSIVTKRYCKANNKYLPDFDPSKPIVYLLFLDFNNLYGRAMMDYLPFKDFRWLALSPKLIRKILKTPSNAKTGYILEVTMSYPKKLHKAHASNPIAPEKRKTSYADLSPVAKHICDAHNLRKSLRAEKLTCTFNKRAFYVLHYRNLQLYTKLGMVLERVHRVLAFAQAPIMKGYVEANTAKRAASTNEFDVSYFKLLTNSLFGKTMERADKRSKVRLVSDSKTYEKIVSDMNFKNAKIINEHLVSTESKYSILRMNKPCYLGMSILDISKFYTTDFYYNVLKPLIEASGGTLEKTYGDTDSEVVAITGIDDVYQALEKFKEYFDFSNYPKDHFLYSTKNKKVPGLIKDECKSKIIDAFVGLRSKMYSIRMAGGENRSAGEMKTAKGVKKCVISQDLSFDTYVKCLFDNVQTENEFSSIRSSRHEVYTTKQVKVGLSPFDDKRYLLNFVESLPYGDYRIAS